MDILVFSACCNGAHCNKPYLDKNDYKRQYKFTYFF